MAKKSQKSTPEYDSQRETRVLLEQIRSEVKVVSEQHGSITQNLYSIRSELETVKIAVMENSLQIKGLKVGQKELKFELEEMKVGQKRIEKKLDDSLSNHDQRICKLEEKVGI